jgi:hypothetical protein
MLIFGAVENPSYKYIGNSAVKKCKNCKGPTESTVPILIFGPLNRVIYLVGCSFEICSAVV